MQNAEGRIGRDYSPAALYRGAPSLMELQMFYFSDRHI